MITTTGFKTNVTWTPFIRGAFVGYRCTRLSDGAETFIYLNPSTSGSPDDEPDVFLYMGSALDTDNEDDPQHFSTPEFT